MEELKFLISDVLEVFNLLEQAFTKTPIFQHFNPKYYIWIKTNTAACTIENVLSQLTSHQLTLNADLT